MSETFCPFIKSVCRNDCVFFQSVNGSPEDCQLLVSVKNISSYVGYLSSIDTNVSQIKSNLDGND